MSPHQEPLLVRWDDLDREEVRPGVRRCAFGTEDVLLVLNELEPGMEVRPHSHDFAQIAMILEGTARFDVDGAVHEVRAGSVLLIPPNAVHHGEPAGDERVVNLDVFAPPRADYEHLLDWMRGRAA